MSNDSCAVCHVQTDPIGLGLENFDGLGGWRDQENGNTIDASGDLDGVMFVDAWGLGDVVKSNPNVGPCLSKTLFQYATGQAAPDSDDALLDWHARGFADSGYRIQWLIQDIAASPGFRNVAEVDQ